VAGTYTWTAQYSGDANNNPVNDQGGIAEQTVVRPATPALFTLASPLMTTLPAGPPGMVTLTDFALLLHGYYSTGNLVFTLTGPGGFLYTQTDTVSGNSVYAASVTPTAGTVVTGTYTWSVTYSGDANNAAAHDQGNVAEQTVVSAARPTLVTTASPDVILPTGPPGTVTLSDSALLSGGYFPTGSIAFTLTGPGGFSFTQNDTVSGNGAYTASTILPIAGPVAGTYTWTVQYGGDPNNAAANDQGGVGEQTAVSPATPTLTTIPAPTMTPEGATLQDSAELADGFYPTGNLVFNLYAPGVDATVGPPVYTETVTVNGNNTYHTTVGFVSNATGIWHWVATYSSDDNNNRVISGPTDEPVTVGPVADLAIAKTVNTSSPFVGTDVTYTYVIHNHGPDPAENVVVTDPFPAGLTFVSFAVPSQGTFDPATSTWTVGTLANGATAALQVTALVDVLGPITNTAKVATDTFDPDLSNNVGSATVVAIPPPPPSKRDFLASAGDPPADPPDMKSAVSFVTNLYGTLLLRAPDAPGAALWINALEAGVPRQSIVQALWNSPEHLGIEVNQLYFQTLHRAADPTGETFWVHYLLQGHGENDLEALLLGSPEYQTAHSSAASFIQGLYADVLFRNPSAAESSAWLQVLQAGTSRSAIAQAIVKSSEAITDAISKDYTQFLLRPAAPTELNAWLAAEQSGAASLDEVSQLILASEEFFARP
jgi:uncharacterized repeat protein (TIGR01451 family)